MIPVISEIIPRRQPMPDEVSRDQPWAIWVGDEVEGRYKGISTLFFYCKPPADQLAEFQESILELMKSRGHFFFCSHWIDFEGFGLIVKALTHGAVTLEVRPDQLHTLTPRLIEMCHLLIALPSIQNFRGYLKPTDSIRIQFFPYHTATATYHAFLVAYPHDYELADQPLWNHPKGLRRR
jgi:hypothetical protein